MSRVDVKVVLLGRSGVGKSCLVERFIYGSFQSNSQATVGSAYFSKKELVGDRPVQLGIWDTAGSERFESMTKIYYRGAGAAIICYDLTDADSFGRANFWLSELKLNVQNCAVYLVGCKLDMIESGERKRAIAYDDVKRFADTSGVRAVFETSAKSGAGVEPVFSAIAAEWLQENPAAARTNSALGGSRTLSQPPSQAQPGESSDCPC